MADSLASIISQLDPVYTPQKQLVQQQADALPAQQQAEQAGLEQAKTNAFNDINQSANAKGMFYSGAPIQEQQRYIGEKYLPAMANLQNTYTNKRLSLASTIAGLTADQMKQAQGVRNGQLQAEQDAAAKIQAARIAASSKVSSRQPTAAEQKTAARGQLNSDLASAFNGFGSRPSFYTEKVIIPQLIQAYPEFTQDEIKNAVYGYRQTLGFN